MGYETEITLIASIRKDKIGQARQELADPETSPFPLLAISCDNCVQFKPDENYYDSEFDKDEEGLVPALKAKWRSQDISFVDWMAQYVTAGSGVYVHSLEVDGEEYGYEFDGKGRYRLLALRPTSGWIKPEPRKPPVRAKLKKQRNAGKKVSR